MTDHKQAGIDRIEAYLTVNAMASRKTIMERTFTGVPEFQAATAALGLVRHSSAAALRWSLPSTRTVPSAQNNTMTAPAYVPPKEVEPRPGSLRYKEFPTVGMPT